MAGMHRDKCGAAAVAGFFKVRSYLNIYRMVKRTAMWVLMLLQYIIVTVYLLACLAMFNILFKYFFLDISHVKTKKDKSSRSYGNGEE